MATTSGTASPPGGGGVRPARRQILTDNVYEAVKGLVMDHHIPPGSRVNIDALARELEVSPTPLREALARLESDGLVVKEPLRGYSTTTLLRPKELDDLYELRMLLEPVAAAKAAARIDAEGRARLQAELATCSEAPPGGEYDAYKEMTAHDNRFHDLIMELSGNVAMRDALERTHVHLHLFRLYYGSGIGMKALKEHQRIVRAIGSGNEERAAAAMRSHLETARKRFTGTFR